MAGASNAMAQILKHYPASDLAANSLAALWRRPGGCATSRRRRARCFEQFLAAVSRFAAAPAGGTGHRPHLRAGTELAGRHRPIPGLAERFSDQRVAAAGGLRAGAGEFPGRKRDQRVRAVHQFRRAVSDRTTSRRWRNGGWPTISSASAGRITWTRKEIIKCVYQNTNWQDRPWFTRRA